MMQSTVYHIKVGDKAWISVVDDNIMTESRAWVRQTVGKDKRPGAGRRSDE